MRPANIFFNIQLSNSRIAEGKGAGKQYHYGCGDSALE